VLITNCDPLRVFIFKEGLARFATMKYNLPEKENIEQIYMHLTNYSLNKFNKQVFLQNDDTQGDGNGHKRSLTYIL